ncbi:MAG: aminoglycoside phosphotransferase family protein [Hydrogenoanaerobacterium sp.]
MNEISSELLSKAVDSFAIDGKKTKVEIYGNGHINDTFAAYFENSDGSTTRYIIQRINSSVFKKPKDVMENVIGVTRYLKEVIEKAGGDPMRETLNLIPTRSGEYYYVDSFGEYWRAYVFIEDTITVEVVKNSTDFYNSARAFAKFQLLLADYPAATLRETIPKFHNTPDRIRQFKEALSADKLNRAAGAKPEIDFVLEREEFTHLLVDKLEKGELPLRVTHNDTKLNNVLMDKKTGDGICIVDLDTVMPGLSLYDFGDSIRFGATHAAEDERDLDKVHFEIDLFEIYTKGYLEILGDVLTENELDNLPESAKMITLECGSRFLTDHLAGDVYYKIHREGHNLDRARTQFKLVKEMEEQWDAMHKVVDKYRKKK